jgi:hypothetical protein
MNSYMFLMTLSGMGHRKDPNHIRLVKRPTKGTQQRAEVLDRQLGQRVSDSYIVDMAYQRMSSQYGQTSQEELSSLAHQTTGLCPRPNIGVCASHASRLD